MDAVTANKNLYNTVDLCFNIRYQQAIYRRDVGSLIEAVKSNHLPPLQILDLACGYGKQVKQCLDFMTFEQGRVTAVDVSEKAIERTKLLCGDDVRLRAEVCEANQFLERSCVEYDIILLVSSLHHISDYLRTVELMCGRLKPKGQLYIGLEPDIGKDSRLNKLLKVIDYNLGKLKYKSCPKPPFGSPEFIMSEPHSEGINVLALLRCLRFHGFKVRIANAPGYVTETCFRIANALGINNHVSIRAWRG